MSTRRRRRILIATLTISVCVSAFVLTKKGDGQFLVSFFEQHPTARRVARGACELVGLEKKFDERFTRQYWFYVQFTN